MEEILSSLLGAAFKDSSFSIRQSRKEETTIQVEPGTHRTALKALLEKDDTTTISAITGIDMAKDIEIRYHFRFLGTIITIITSVPKSKAEINSITDILPGANFHEREVSDFFGVVFLNHPNPKRLILPDNWPENLFPLRKDANLEDVMNQISPITNPSITDNPSTKSQIITLTMGPQHPALLEPERFVLDVDGERIRKVEPRIGYCHRAVEKATESRRYPQNVYLVERICGICNSCHSSCFCQAVEAILGVEIPPKAKYLRTLVLELNRIQSHLLVLGHACLEIGYQSVFQYMWRDREPMMDLMEIITGNRVHASIMAIGGVRADLNTQKIPLIKSELDKLGKRVDFYKHLFETDITFKGRTKNIGLLSKKDALELCVVGPVARGSGLKMDVRKNQPYFAYGEIPFNMITYPSGDSWSRLMVRLDEISESIQIIDYIVDHLPSGPYRIKVPRVVPANDSISRVEAPRGELFYYVKGNGTRSPERVKVRTPTYANILSFVSIAQGVNVADIPASFVSLDPCFSCTDR
ncbi:MAG: NADH-quinone oxidoreductase subunit C [Promethearchaeota archaeon]